MSESKLVKVAFFISPGYWDESKKRGEHVTQPDDNRDTLPDWLRKNSIVERVEEVDEHTNWGSYAFIGENGVYCNIYQIKNYGLDPQHDFFGVYGDYKRVVRVQAMPSSRELPSELTSAFESRGYEIATKESEEVKRVFG